MSILLSDSYDLGETWSPLRLVPMPDDIGPASLTNPLLKLTDGTLAMCIESNKHYHDSSTWYQKAVFFHSGDRGQTWGEPLVAGQDPEARIFYWDMRAAVAPDGRVGTFIWTYDRQTSKYLNIHRKISEDGARTWGDKVDLGFADQAAHPAVLSDGRVVLGWVDRFGSRSIRAREAPNLDAPFDESSEVEIYVHPPAGESEGSHGDTGELLEDMSLWSFGLPFLETLHDGDVLAVYYAGTESAMDVHWARLTTEDRPWEMSS